MAALRHNMGIFGEEGGLNAKEKSEVGSRGQEEKNNQSKEEPKKDQPNSSVMNQSLFKVEKSQYQSIP